MYVSTQFDQRLRFHRCMEKCESCSRTLVLRHGFNLFRCSLQCGNRVLEVAHENLGRGLYTVGFGKSLILIYSFSRKLQYSETVSALNNISTKVKTDSTTHSLQCTSLQSIYKLSAYNEWFLSLAQRRFNILSKLFEDPRLKRRWALNLVGICSHQLCYACLKLTIRLKLHNNYRQLYNNYRQLHVVHK